MFKNFAVLLMLAALGCDDASAPAGDAGPTADAVLADVGGRADADLDAAGRDADRDAASPDAAVPDATRPPVDRAVQDERPRPDTVFVDVLPDAEPDAAPDAAPPADGDGDGVPDAVDLCPQVADPDQDDFDRDGQGDACDADDDNDGFPDEEDLCPALADENQLDGDADGRGDACDACPRDPFDDADQDGHCGDVDVCPGVADPGQGDGDGDGQGDACDACPADPGNDRDGDGVCGDIDVCPEVPDVAQENADGDGRGDACDPCPQDPLDDTDGDGRCADVDVCPEVPDPMQENADGDPRGDACDPCPRDPLDDADGDGLCADEDSCPDLFDPDPDDLDGDGLGDACDADDDQDGIDDLADNCPRVANADQGDDDGDGAGNACDPPTCDDGVHDGEETGRDCGGPCPACAPGEGCAGPGDCVEGVCADGRCAEAACDDGVANGDEADVDCGGACPGCPPGGRCHDEADCREGVCLEGRCAEARCDDGVANGAETDVDCGGPVCAPCGPGQACVRGGDCGDDDPCTVDTCAADRCIAPPLPEVYRFEPVAADLSSVSPVEAIAVHPVTGEVFIRSQQNPAGFSIQFARVSLAGERVILSTFPGLQSSNLSGLGIDPVTDTLIFAEEIHDNRGRIATFNPRTGAVGTLWPTPWELNPLSNGAGQMRFAPDPREPFPIFFFDHTTAAIYRLGRGPGQLALLLDLDDGQPDGLHQTAGTEVRWDHRVDQLLVGLNTTGEIFHLDPDSGVRRPLFQVNPGTLRVAAHPGLDRIYVARAGQVWAGPPDGGALTAIAELPGLVDLDVGPDPTAPSGLRVYAASRDDDTLYRLVLVQEECFVAPTCEDGLQNGDEAGVDCGRPCPACELPPPCMADADCDDRDPCTTDVCSAGDCAHAVEPGACPDVDLDGDGLANGVEAVLGLNPLVPDSDGDGAPDGAEDADGDALTNLQELRGGVQVDTDLDEVPDLLDPDSDGDGLADVLEAGDADLASPPADHEGDDTPDFRDDDSDGDGLLDAVEAPDQDLDGDGVLAFLDDDSDGDGRPDGGEGALDRDGDGRPNFLDPHDRKVFSGHDVQPVDCSGQAIGGLCSGGNYLDIRFPTPFERPPHVLVVPEDVSRQGGCVGGATDKVVAYPSDITREGFRLWAYGSPAGGDCGEYNGWSTRAAAGWLAVEDEGGVLSDHQLFGNQCSGQAVGGLCNGTFYRDVVFRTPFDRPPHVLVAVEAASDQGGCVGGATDKIVGYPTDITATGFRMWIAGSPTACGNEEGWSSLARGGWLAIPQGPQIDSAHGLRPLQCTGAAQGGLCNGEYFTEVAFPRPFLDVPHLLVAPEVISEQDGCVGGATDKVVARPEGLAHAGFRLFARGSPEGPACGGFSSWGSVGRGGWLGLQ